MIYYEIVNKVPVSKDEVSVMVRIVPDAPLNGFHSSDIHFIANPKTIKKDVRDRVKWKVNDAIRLKDSELGDAHFEERVTL